MHTVKIAHGANGEFTAPINSQGLTQISTMRLHAGQVRIHIPYGELNEEARVNFIAMCQKSMIHLNFVLGMPAGHPVHVRTRVWRKFFRNRVDQEHNEGVPWLEFITRFLADAMITFIKCTPEGFIISGRFASPVMLAAAVGRIVNMLRWCGNWTANTMLISEANFTWETFNKITLDAEQPIVRRRK